MITKFIRGLDPKRSIDIGSRALIEKWFEEFTPGVNYEIDDNLNISIEIHLYLVNTNISSLHNNLIVGRALYLNNTNITSISDNLTVGEWLDLVNTNITSLPDNLTVKGTIYKDF